MEELLTVLIQTSPIPSHPSTALLEAVVESFAKADGLLESNIIIVADGCQVTSEANEENVKHGQVSLSTSKRYRGFLARLEELIQTQTPPFCPQKKGSIQLLQLSKRHGSAGAIEAVFENVVTTPLVIVGQHDHLFIHPTPLRQLVQAMHENPGLGIGANCVHFMNISNKNYISKVQRRYGLDLVPQRVDNCFYQDNYQFVPLIFWYGRTHVAYSDYFRNFVLNRSINTGDHLEELLGPPQLQDICQRGPSSHSDYGTYVLDQRNQEVLYHLSGRRVIMAEEASVENDSIKTDGSNTEEAGSAARAQTNGGEKESLSSFTTARTCRATVPGLTFPQKNDTKPGGGRRFRQKCFHCGKKGHSKKWCPYATKEDTVLLDLTSSKS